MTSGMLPIYSIKSESEKSESEAIRSGVQSFEVGKEPGADVFKVSTMISTSCWHIAVAQHGMFTCTGRDFLAVGWGGCDR